MQQAVSCTTASAKENGPDNLLRAGLGMPLEQVMGFRARALAAVRGGPPPTFLLLFIKRLSAAACVLSLPLATIGLYYFTF